MVEVWEPTPAATAEPAAPAAPLTLRCIAIETNSPTVKTFTFENSSGKAIEFLPGQFIQLSATIGEQTIQRAYTIASAPMAHSEVLELTIKRDGQFTHWLFDEFQVGDSIDSSLPLGGFTLSPYATDKLLLIAGGVGLTPMLAMSRYIAAMRPQQEVVLISCARSADETLFYEELSALEQQLPHFKFIQFIDQKSEKAHAKGVLTLNWLRNHVPDLILRSIYCCGPQGFMDKVQGITQMLGFPQSQFYSESFAPSFEQGVNPFESAELPSQSFTMTLQDWQRELSVSNQASILQAYDSQQQPIVAMCRNGTCRSCAKKLVSGEVEEILKQALSAEERAAGYFLPCACKAKSDLIVAG